MQFMNETIDAKGLLCPLPVLRLRKRIRLLATGDVIVLISDDPAAVIDVPHFCSEAGHTLISIFEESGAKHFLVRKGA